MSLIRIGTNVILETIEGNVEKGFQDVHIEGEVLEIFDEYVHINWNVKDEEDTEEWFRCFKVEDVEGIVNTEGIFFPIVVDPSENLRVDAKNCLQLQLE